LDAFAYPTILEALRGIRGFATSYDGIYGNVNVRGLGQANDFGNRLLLLSDGAVLNEALLYQPLLHYDGRVDLGDIERIEIVRGPASVLYGNGAVSGVVNLVTQQRTLANGVTGEVSSHDNATQRARIRGSYRSRVNGIWTSIAVANSSGRDTALVFPLVDGEPSSENLVRTIDKFTAGTITGRAWHKGLTLQWFGTARHLYFPIGNGSTFNDPNTVFDDRRRLLELKYDGALSKVASITARTFYNYTYFHLDSGASNDSLVRADYRYKQTYKSHGVGAELRSVFRLGTAIKLTSSGEFTAALKQSMRGGDDSVEPGTIVEALRVEAPNQKIAGSLLLDRKINNALRINAGVRADYTNSNGNRLAIDDAVGKVTLLAFSPRLAVIVKPTPRPQLKGDRGTLNVVRDPDNKQWRIELAPTEHLYQASNSQLIEYLDRSPPHHDVDWRKLPVSAIVLEDALAYLQWLDRTGQVPGARLCTEHEWERAARGADDRLFPSGDSLEPSSANFDETYGRSPRAFGPDAVGSHPASDSPFGVADLAGNVWEWTTSCSVGQEVTYRGGSWYESRMNARSNIVKSVNFLSATWS
jgi:hypothetical protein